MVLRVSRTIQRLAKTCYALCPYRSTLWCTKWLCVTVGDYVDTPGHVFYRGNNGWAARLQLLRNAAVSQKCFGYDGAVSRHFNVLRFSRSRPLGRVWLPLFLAILLSFWCFGFTICIPVGLVFPLRQQKQLTTCVSLYAECNTESLNTRSEAGSTVAPVKRCCRTPILNRGMPPYTNDMPPYTCRMPPYTSNIPSHTSKMPATVGFAPRLFSDVLHFSLKFYISPSNLFLR